MGTPADGVEVDAGVEDEYRVGGHVPGIIGRCRGAGAVLPVAKNVAEFGVDAGLGRLLAASPVRAER